MTPAEKKLEQVMETKRQAPDHLGIYADPLSKGVSIAWLAQVFELDPRTVKLKLANCPAKSVKARGSVQVTMYDVKDAAGYLVRPSFSTSTYMRHLKANELPPAIQQAVWDALLKRQKWEENAGDLWRTDKIRQVLSGTFQNIKFTLQLWVETLERTTEISAKQRALILQMVEGLQSDLYQSLVGMSEKTSTGAQIDELPELIGEDTDLGELVDQFENEDTEIDGMI